MDSAIGYTAVPYVVGGTGWMLVRGFDAALLY